jgi:hypothetical protein
MTPADSITSAAAPETAAPALRPTAVRPSALRAISWRSRDILGLAWLHGAFHAAVFRRQTLVASWQSPIRVHSLEEFESALDAAIAALAFDGTEAFLVLEHDEFVHQAEHAPPFSDSAARKYLRGLVMSHEMDHEPVLWVSQRMVSARQEAAFLLHLLPSGFHGRLNGLLLARRLDLTRILPLVVPLQLMLDGGLAPRDQAVLLAAEAGDATTVMAGRGDGQLLFARTMAAGWATDAGRIGVEANRSVLYAKQQFGAAIDRIYLLGGAGEDARASVQAKCGPEKLVELRPATPLDWLQAVAKLSARHPVNLVAGQLGRKRRQQFLRRVLLAGCWLGFGLMALNAWSRGQSWRQELRHFDDLRSHATDLRDDRDRLQQRNAGVARNRAFVRQAAGERLPPVPGKFLEYLGAVLPATAQLTRFETKWEPATGRWTFRLEGLIEGDDETARETLASFQAAVGKSPLHARFNDAGRTLTAVPAVGSALPTTQRFGVEGGFFEN